MISIDTASARNAERAGASERVLHIAEAFDWHAGPKSVVVHEQLGLVEHFHRCGDLTATYGRVVLLEDDLLVGPGFHQWASDALEFADKEPRIAGVGLVTPWFDGYRRLRFEPIDDGSDGVFMQVPWYDGMAWTARMWNDYRTADIDDATPLHAAFDELDSDEWFPQYMRYLVQSDRVFLLPRSAQATGTGASGTHFDDATDWFQTALAAAAPRPVRLLPLDESLSVYDDHMELTTGALQRLTGGLVGDPVVMDLRGSRNLDELEPDAWVLTTRPATAAKRSWGAAMHPLEMNVVHDEPGVEISLARARDVDASEAGDRVVIDRLRAHHQRGQSTSRGDALAALVPGLGGLRDRLRRGR